MPAPPRRLPIAVLAAAAAFLAAPASAPAAQVLFGSDLAAHADAIETHGANTILWNDTVASRRPGPPGEPVDPQEGIRRYTTAASPRDGQLRYVTIYGGVPPGGSPLRFHFAVLRPRAGGTIALEQIERTQLHALPVSPDPANRVPNKSINWDLCLEKDDRLGLLQLDPGSMRVFATIPGSVTSWFENAAGVAAGNVFTGTPSQDRELLMEVLVNTGPDASSRCAGGYREHVYSGLDFGDRRAHLEPGTRTLRLKARCPAQTYGGCTGRLALRAKIGGHERTLGRTTFDFVHGHSGALRVGVSRADAALVRSRGTLRATAVTVGHDDPTDPRNRHAPGTRPGRQSGTFALPVFLLGGP
jgi:hypothetical protein